jgi:uncharacterized membrane protein YsdA (DUF1294 family)
MQHLEILKRDSSNGLQKHTTSWNAVAHTRNKMGYKCARARWFLGRFAATPEVCVQQRQRVRFASTKEEGEEAAALASTFFGNNHLGNVSEGWYDGFFGNFSGNIFLDNKERLWERFWQRPRRQHVRERFRKAVLWRDGLLFGDLGTALVPVNEVSRREKKKKWDYKCVTCFSKVSHVWVLFVAICNINQIMLTSVNSNNFSNLLGKFCQIIFLQRIEKK